VGQKGLRPVRRVIKRRSSMLAAKREAAQGDQQGRAEASRVNPEARPVILAHIRGGLRTVAVGERSREGLRSSPAHQAWIASAWIASGMEIRTGRVVIGSRGRQLIISRLRTH
jgi:hypothetical protein